MHEQKQKKKEIKKRLRTGTKVKQRNRDGMRMEWIIQRTRDRDMRRRDVDGWETEGISKQTGRWGGWVERYNDCRSAGNDKERWTHNRALLSLYQITEALLIPLSLFLLSAVFVYVGLIWAFRHRNKASGNAPLRSWLEAACPNAKNNLKQRLSKWPSSKREDFESFGIEQEDVEFYSERRKCFIFWQQSKKIKQWHLTLSCLLLPLLNCERIIITFDSHFISFIKSNAKI